MTTEHDIMFEMEIHQEEIDECIEKRDMIELDPDDYIDEYNEYLKTHEYIYLSGVSFPTDTLKEQNPSAYNLGLHDFVNTHCDVCDTEEYQYLTERIDELEGYIEHLEEQLNRIKNNEDEE